MVGEDSKVQGHPWLQANCKASLGDVRPYLRNKTTREKGLCFVSFRFTYLSKDSKVEISKQLLLQGFCYKLPQQELVLVADSADGCPDCRWKTLLEHSLPSHYSLGVKFGLNPSRRASSSIPSGSRTL